MCIRDRCGSAELLQAGDVGLTGDNCGIIDGACGFFLHAPFVLWGDFPLCKHFYRFGMAFVFMSM